jgi:cell division septum initiation protein DivIVA
MRLKNLAWVLCAVVMLATSSFSAHAAQSNGRKLYKWVDQQGLTHYGDHIPPEYANQEQHIVNSQGIETEHIDAQKTPQQLAADEQKKLDAEQRASRDRNLLNTYSSVSEIERLRDQRLALLSDQIKVTGQFLEILDGRLKKLRGASMHFKPYSDDPKAPPMSDQVAEDLVRVDNDMHTQEANLREKRSEEATMRKQFESDIARFKELKGIH